MVETITPVVHGGSRGRWGLSIGLHTVGATGSAAAAGAALGAAGSALGAPWGPAGLVAVAAVALAYALREAGALPVPVPAARRQVPDWWRTFFGPHAAALLYGAGLGVGFLTYLSHGTLVVVALAAFVAGDPVLGALAVGAFGAARGLSLLLPGPAPTAEASGVTVDRLTRLGGGPLPRLVNGLALLALAGAAVLAASRAGAGGAGGPRAVTVAAGSAAILAAALGWAALSKAARPSAWRAALGAHDLGRLEPPTALAVPAAEAAVAGVLLFGPAPAGAAAAVALLATFSLALVRTGIRSGDRRVPCGCFGRRDRVDVRVALLRNAALAGLGVLVLVGPTPDGPLLGPPAAGEVAPAILALAGVGLGVWVGWEVLRTRRPGARRTTAARSVVGGRP